MKDSTKKILYTVLLGLPSLLIIWALSLYFFGCRTNNTCNGATVVRTPIPPLPVAYMPDAASQLGGDNLPKCKVTPITLLTAWIAAGTPEKTPFTFVDVKERDCTATFTDDVQKFFVTPNLMYSGAPACTTCHNAALDPANKSMDLSSYSSILAGSNRTDGSATGNDILGGGDPTQALLLQMLYAPNGQTTIGRPPMPFGRPADVPAEGPVINAGTPATTAAQ